MPTSLASAVTQGQSGPSPTVVFALRRALRPLVRFMLLQGITYPYLAELLKKMFVELAEQECSKGESKPPNDSRISVATGVHRKDVSRLREELATHGDKAVPEVLSLGAQILALWLGDEQYTDEHGKPIPLMRLARDGKALSFEALVMRINTDVRSRVVLDEWLRLGMVTLGEDKRVYLNSEAFVPAAGIEEKLFYLGHNLHDHAAAAVHNMLGTAPPFMERCVHYDGLAESSIAQLSKQAKELGMKALLSLNKTAMQAEQTDAALLQAEPGTSMRMTMGVYFYAEPSNTAATARPVDTGTTADSTASEGASA